MVPAGNKPFAASLTVFLAMPHARTPDRALKRDDICDVSAYSLSLDSEQEGC